MVVVGHQAIGVKPQCETFSTLPNVVQKLFPVSFVLEKLFACIAPVNNMVKGTRILHTQWPRHDQHSLFQKRIVQLSVVEKSVYDISFTLSIINI